MSVAEIIESIKTLPRKERETVLRYLNQDLTDKSSLYDEFSLLGEEPEGNDVSYAMVAPAVPVL
jgi:hypothetical protein